MDGTGYDGPLLVGLPVNINCDVSFFVIVQTEEAARPLTMWTRPSQMYPESSTKILIVHKNDHLVKHIFFLSLW